MLNFTDTACNRLQFQAAVKFSAGCQEQRLSKIRPAGDIPPNAAAPCSLIACRSIRPSVHRAAADSRTSGRRNINAAMLHKSRLGALGDRDVFEDGVAYEDSDEFQENDAFQDRDAFKDVSPSRTALSSRTEMP